MGEPRVARASAFAALRRGTSQPWALRRNPFGIADAYKEQAGAVALQNLAEIRTRAVLAIAFWTAGALSRFGAG